MRGVQRRAVPDSPVVVSVPHNGTCVPPAVAARLAVPVDQVRTRVDDGAWTLARMALPCATVVKARYARVVIDLNRSGTVTDVDLGPAHELDGDRLVRLFDRSGQPLWRAAPGAPYLSRVELEERLRLYYAPYHAALADAVQRAPRPCALVDMHSMAETAHDLVVGDFRGRSAGVEFCEQVVQAFFAGRGYRVGYAGPRDVDRRGRLLSPVAVRHSGGFITSRYGDPANGCMAIQIEASRARIRQRPAAMAQDFRDFFAHLCDYLLAARPAAPQEE